MAPGELPGGVHQLLKILLPQGIGEMFDLTCGRVDVFGDLRFVLLAHLAAGIMEGGGHRVEGAGQTLLLGGDLRRDLRGRLLASRVDELAGLLLCLADDFRSLLGHAAACAARCALAMGAGTSSGRTGA